MLALRCSSIRKIWLNTQSSETFGWVKGGVYSPLWSTIDGSAKHVCCSGKPCANVKWLWSLVLCGRLWTVKSGSHPVSRREPHPQVTDWESDRSEERLLEAFFLALSTIFTTSYIPQVSICVFTDKAAVSRLGLRCKQSWRRSMQLFLMAQDG